jgi:hypothetical protein
VFGDLTVAGLGVKVSNLVKIRENPDAGGFASHIRPGFITDTRLIAALRIFASGESADGSPYRSDIRLRKVVSKLP